MRFCRFDDGKLGVVEGSNVRGRHGRTRRAAEFPISVSNLRPVHCQP